MSDWYSINISTVGVTGESILDGFININTGEGDYPNTNSINSFFIEPDRKNSVLNKTINSLNNDNSVSLNEPGTDGEIFDILFTFDGTIISRFPYFSNKTKYSSASHYLLYCDTKSSPLESSTVEILFLDSSLNIISPKILKPFTANLTFTLLQDAPLCFNEGTKILCLNKDLKEEYIPIENLSKGDFVKSYKHGYRKIDMIGNNKMITNNDHFNLCMYKMVKTESNGLIEDLIVTGGHGILVDNLGDLGKKNKELFKGKIPTIDDKYILLAAISPDFVKLENQELYTYYNLTLENNGDDDKRFGIWANGLLTETPSNNQFKENEYKSTV
jgi:hypothetical protein